MGRRRTATATAVELLQALTHTHTYVHIRWISQKWIEKNAVLEEDIHYFVFPRVGFCDGHANKQNKSLHIVGYSPLSSFSLAHRPAAIDNTNILSDHHLVNATFSSHTKTNDGDWHLRVGTAELRIPSLRHDAAHCSPNRFQRACFFCNTAELQKCVRFRARSACEVGL